jgi:hypothetical protein
MKSRSYPPGVAAHIIKAGQGKSPAHDGWSCRRLLALLERDDLLDWERERQEREDELHESVLAEGNPFGRRRTAFEPVTGKPFWLWGPKERRIWCKLTRSQVALWLSGFVETQHGGGYSRPFRAELSIRDHHNVSRRMLFMALKLRKSGNAVLIRAVAEGGVSLGDAIAHLDRDKDELRKAIRMVERREARSLRQALAAIPQRDGSETLLSLPHA